MEKSERIQSLKKRLAISKCNHKIEIMKEDLKGAHSYCKDIGLSGQVTGPLIEYYIQNKYGMIKNKSSSCNGDLQYKQINYEIKVSTGGTENNKFNYVQLRMNHDCQYILTAYYLHEYNVDEEGELFIFKLTKPDIKKIIVNHGGYAHGTIEKLGKITEEDLETLNNKEYAIRPKYGDKCWNDLLQFRIQEIQVQCN